MGEKHEEQQGMNLPQPLERLRRAGGSVIGMMLNNDTYYEDLRDQDAAGRDREDDMVTGLRERVHNLDEQEEIEKAKHRHPSQRGYL